MAEAEFQGTAGDWIAAAKPSSVVGWPVVSTHEGRVICSIAWQAKPAHVSQAAYDAYAAECQANATLIGAAKALLAACQSAIPKNLATNNRNIPDDQIIPLDFTMGELRRIQAAIAKALGSAA